MVKVSKTVLGFFAFSLDGNLVEEKRFNQEPREIAEILESNEFEKWVNELKEKGYSIDGEIPAAEAFELLNVSKEDLKKTIPIIREISKIRVKNRIKRDILVIQAISYLEELNKVINIIFNRYKEWFLYYWPEFDANSMEGFAKAIEKERPENSMGLDISEIDKKMLKDVANTLYSLLKHREEVEKYIEKLMNEVAPNVAAIATPKVGAMLIERAGGLEALSKMPASTIQVLGAEKALFKHLSKGTPAPKHGVLFQHPIINRAPRKIRGKLARAIAAKIAIASRIDLNNKGLNEELIKQLEKRIKEVVEDGKK